MASPTRPAPATSSPLRLLRDVRFLNAFGQVVFLILVILALLWLFNNSRRGLARAGMSLGFDFLDRPSSFQIDEGLVPQPHTRDQTFGHAFLIGFVNTLRVCVVGLVLTTILGLVMGIGRLSTNWLIRQIAVVYIEVMQNTPLYLQLIFLYSGVILLFPRVSEAIVLPGPIYLTVRGMAMPGPYFGDTSGIWFVLILAASVIGLVVWRQRRAEWIRTGKPTYGVELGLGIVFAAAVLSGLVLKPFVISLPQTLGPRFVETEGIILSPEFVAIVAGLVLYTGAFVAEIVRAGIQSVPTGQWEAARAQGLNYFQILRLVVLPQALRVMIPPLTNQYLNLIKNSSLGAAVGFSDLFGVGKTVQLQSGQSVQVIIVIMVTYLALDLLAAWVMNVINARSQIRVR